MAATARPAAPPLANTPLGRTVATTPTDIWNDSCAVDELEYAISFGAVGATANPAIVMDVWRRDAGRWRRRVGELAVERPSATGEELAWAVVEEMSIAGAALLRPAFVEHEGRQGRLSVQVDPTLFRSRDRMVAQALRFDGLAPNVIVKLPATEAGIEAMEETTFRGVTVNATVCCTVSQALAAAEAVERGLHRRKAEGLPIEGMGPVVTIMMGRLEDWLRVQAERDGVVVDPAALAWSGIAVFKEAYRIFQERKLRPRLLGAAIRHHYHWSQLIGGDIVITIPAAWQRRFNASNLEVRSRIGEPAPSAYVDELRRGFPDFERAYDVHGLAPHEFDGYRPTIRVLRLFVASYHELLKEVVDVLLPRPDEGSR